MAMQIHQCPRCELRFTHAAELAEHFSLDHRADPATFDRFRYGRAEEGAGARRYLVVANQTLGDDHLERAVLERARAGPARFFVLVPATGASRTAGDDDPAIERAAWRLRTTVDRFRAGGLDVEGEVGAADPYTAVNRLVTRHRFDEILLSTLPPGASRWLEVDLPARLERHARIPVTTLTVEYAQPG